MKKIDVTQARFLASFVEAAKIPDFLDEDKKTLPEIAFVGRSNVGKSSLINYITKKKGLAKTSSTPGKTRMLNFFNVDDALILVDLPGYGFASTHKEEKELWAKELSAFLSHRKQLRALCLLFDVRRDLSEEDLTMLHFGVSLDIRILVIFTKSDKLKPHEASAMVAKNLALIQTFQKKSMDHLLFSAKESASREALIKKISLLVG